MNWGKRIIVKYDKNLYNVTPDLKAAFRLKEMNYGTYIYPIAVTYGADNKELYLEFEDFNNANEPLMLEYIGTSLMGLDLEVDTFETYPALKNLNYKGNFEYLETGINVIGEMFVAFDGKAYLDEHVQASIAVSGTQYLVTYKEGYLQKEHVEMSVNVTGIYCDVNGVPI